MAKWILNRDGHAELPAAKLCVLSASLRDSVGRACYGQSFVQWAEGGLTMATEPADIPPGMRRVYRRFER